MPRLAACETRIIQLGAIAALDGGDGALGQLAVDVCRLVCHRVTNLLGRGLRISGSTVAVDEMNSIRKHLAVPLRSFRRREG